MSRDKILHDSWSFLAASSPGQIDEKKKFKPPIDIMIQIFWHMFRNQFARWVRIWFSEKTIVKSVTSALPKYRKDLGQIRLFISFFLIVGGHVHSDGFFFVDLSARGQFMCASTTTRVYGCCLSLWALIFNSCLLRVMGSCFFIQL